MKDILDKLKGMDKNQLEDMVKQAKVFAETPKGKELVAEIKSSGLKKTQHAEIMEKLEKNPDVAKAIFDILKG